MDSKCRWFKIKAGFNWAHRRWKLLLVFWSQIISVAETRRFKFHVWNASLSL